MRVYKFFFATLLFLVNLASSACPCGCGALTPLALSPDESWKFNTSLTYERDKSIIKANGKNGFDDGPSSAQNLSFGIAKAITTELAFTINTTIQINYHKDAGRDLSFGDPNIGIMWTAWTPSFIDPFIPKVQIYSSIKPAIAKSLDDISVKNHSLDIHGNGYHEFMPGISLWFDMHTWVYGFSSELVMRLPKEVTIEETNEKITKTPSLGLNLKFKAGYTFLGRGQILLGFERKSLGKITINQKSIDNSEQINHSLSITANFRLAHKKMLALSYLKSGGMFKEKNTTSFNSFSFGYIVAI